MNRFSVAEFSKPLSRRLSKIYYSFTLFSLRFLLGLILLRIFLLILLVIIATDYRPIIFYEINVQSNKIAYRLQIYPKANSS